MNPEKSIKPGLPRLLLTALCGSLLAALPATAQISVVNTGFLDDTANLTSYTLSFDAGNGGTADKLIVSAGVESTVAITGITYNGVPLTLIPNTGGGAARNRGIWYLDNPFSGGAADIVVAGDDITDFNHMRLGVASISGSAPGAAIGNVAGAASVSLNVPVNDSLVFAAYAGNDIVPATTADAPLTEIFSVNGDSASMAAGYENSVGAGLATYSFTSTISPQSSATAFVPASAAPVIVSTTPADNVTTVAIGADLVATFSEPVVAGTGNVELWQAGGGAPLEIFVVNPLSSQLIFSGTTLTIIPTSNLTPGVEYYVLIPATAVVDTSGGDAFAGILNPATWSFIIGQIWDGGDADANWTSVLNWQTDVAPDFSKPISFQGSTRFTNQNDLAAASTVGGINFINDGTAFTNTFTLQGLDDTTTNSMTLGGDITTTARPSGTNENQIHASLDVILDGNRTITTNDFHNLRINGQISETGESRSLTKEGVGNLTLGNSSLTTNPNSFSGGININNGSVNLVGSATLGTAAAGTGTINLGATSGSNDAELRLAGSGMNPTNALVVRTGSAGTKTLANRTTNTVIYKGIITANDNLTILGANSGGRLTVDAAGSTIANGKTVSFINTGSAANIMINSAIWGGQGSISYTSSVAMGFQVQGAKTYSGGTTLGAMSGTGEVVVQTSSTGPANAPDDGAFGTGTLSLGATKMRGNNATPTTIHNPVTFIDNPTFTSNATEKSITFTGNASLGATRTLTVEVGSLVATEEVEFSGVISGTGFGIIKEGAGNLLLSGTNTYTGDTTVNAGVLALTGASIADTGTLVINAGTLDLTNTETVSALFFGATPQPDGDYSASSVPVGATITTASFSGAGTLTVGAPAGSAYTLWAATNAPTGTTADDFDGDGVSNGVEFVLGGLATTNDLDKLPTLEADGVNMTFTFDRAVSSIDPKTVVTIEVSTDLVTWDTLPSPYTVPDSATGPVNPGVTVEEDTSPGFDTVTLTVPQDTARKFARLNVIIIP